MGAGGNPCPIVADASALPSDDMKGIAGYFGHESGFVLPAAGGVRPSLYLGVLGMTGLYMLAELVGGLVTGSLALVADSGHLLGDVLGLAMAVAAIRFARRPATAGKTYGFYRAEILAALLNSIALLGVGLIGLFAAARRRSAHRTAEPSPVAL